MPGLTVRSIAWLTVALLLNGAAACTRPESPAGLSGPNPAALDAWRDFPVDRSPRPIVLLGDPAVLSGSATDDMKAALTGRRLHLATTPPAPPPGAQVIAATDAFAALTARRAGTGAELAVDRVTLGTANFATDRGPQALPAWMFTGGSATVAWPALPPGAFWRLGEVHPAATAGSPARLAPDGRSATVSLAVPEGGCGGDGDGIAAVSASSPAAVVVGLRGGRQDGRCGNNDDVLRRSELTVTFDNPLGARVLLTDGGGVIPVEPA